MKDCLYIDNHILVVAKENNIDMETFIKNIKKDLEKENQKSSYLELLYPVSKESSGIVTFALSSKAKERFQKQIENKEIMLKYLAVCVGKPKYRNNIFYMENVDETIEEDKGYFVHRNPKTNRLENIPQLNADAIQIFDKYTTLEENQQISLVSIEGGLKIEDEVRFVMSDALSPIFGDKLYGGDTLAKDTNLALSVVELRFVHPTSNKVMSFRYYPPIDKKPWSYFNVDKYLRI